MSTAIRLIVTIGLLLTLLAAQGCRQRDFATEADVLRSRVLDLEQERERLERQNRELRTQLRQTRLETERHVEVPDDVREQMPQVVSIEMGRLSHARDTTRDGVVDTLVVYIQPRDGRGRFTQVAGDVLINAVILPADDDAVPVARQRITPGQLRDAYRSGITGTHYTLSVPIELPADTDMQWAMTQQAIVRVTLVDGVTGLTHTAERSISLGGQSGQRQRETQGGTARE